MVGAAQVGEEVVVEDLGELHQRVRVNPLAGEDEIDVVAVDRNTTIFSDRLEWAKMGEKNSIWFCGVRNILYSVAN